MSHTERSVLIAIAVVLAAIFLLPSLMGFGMIGVFGGGWPWMIGRFGGPVIGRDFGWWRLFPLTFWLIILAAVVALITRLARGGEFASTAATPPTEETPLDILKKRYARGEITKEEFEEKKRDLGLV